VSDDLHADDTALTASSHGFGREHAPALEATCEDVRGRTSRVVLTPGACASSPVVMRLVQPDARISDLQGDGGNSASLPGESTKDTLKPSRREGRAIRQHLWSTPCAFFVAHGSRVPAGARPSLRPRLCEGACDKQNSGETRREDEVARGSSATNHASTIRQAFDAEMEFSCTVPQPYLAQRKGRADWNAGCPPWLPSSTQGPASPEREHD
jgi:hypothetical protein